MGYMTDGLTFNNLIEANKKRLPLFKNKKGEIAHPEGITHWGLAQWCNAVTGELGEAANIIKKIERGDFSLDEAKEELAKELADVVTYMDILAERAGIDLGKAIINKFNEVSTRIDVDVYMDATGDWHTTK